MGVRSSNAYTFLSTKSRDLSSRTNHVQAALGIAEVVVEAIVVDFVVDVEHLGEVEEAEEPQEAVEAEEQRVE